MGRWTDNSPAWNRDSNPCDELYEVFDSKGNFVSGAPNEWRRKQFIDAHNATCATYEARIAELEAELARVKAESLRVVKDGGPVAMSRLDGNDKLIEHNGDRYYKSGCSYICVDTDVYARLDDDAIVQPVRLERWETEE